MFSKRSHRPATGCDANFGRSAIKYCRTTLDSKTNSAFVYVVQVILIKVLEMLVHSHLHTVRVAGDWFEHLEDGHNT